ncbi:MAG: hypothetical protein GXP18_01190 [Gammaproteobacteria bacterium]|nr:hypothetical protein [Gammaproteobacteria bacterium]
MNEIYPCRIIITSDKQLAQHYNEDPKNALSASSCITVEEGFLLFEEKRKIETIILINGEGEELIHSLGKKTGWDKKNMPNIVRIETSDSYEDTTKTINNAIAKSSLLLLGLATGAWVTSEAWIAVEGDIGGGGEEGGGDGNG